MFGGEKTLREKCESRVIDLVTSDKDILRMLDFIHKAGCEIPRGFFACRTCGEDSNISGGFITRDLDVGNNIQLTSDDPNFCKDTAKNLAKSVGKEYDPRILVCENKQIHDIDLKSTLLHELTHAYDFCRANVDQNDCRQYACLEIRASSLSGECNTYPELLRGNSIFYNSHRDCVKRRAELSIKMNKNCGNLASIVINDVFNSCYKDISPYSHDSEIP